MKKTVIILLTLAMMLTLCACGRQAEAVQVTPQPTQAPEVSASAAEELTTTEEETTDCPAAAGQKKNRRQASRRSWTQRLFRSKYGTIASLKFRLERFALG